MRSYTGGLILVGLGVVGAVASKDILAGIGLLAAGVAWFVAAFAYKRKHDDLS